MWIVGGLYGGYVMANVLKWIWWRFNGYGYFWGMMAGILSAMLFRIAGLWWLRKMYLGHDVSNTLYLFPIILLISIVGCVLGTFLTNPRMRTPLKKFYKNVRPLGRSGDQSATRSSGMIRPSNPTGISAATASMSSSASSGSSAMVTMPIYIVLRQWNWVALIVVLFLVTSAILKFNWYDKLEKA